MKQLGSKNDVARNVHIVIGDTQAKAGVPNVHMSWIGQYIVDQFAGRNVTLIGIGDHWDMPSLSSYDRGKKAMEGQRYLKDVEAGNRSWELLNAPLKKFNVGVPKRLQWHPSKHITLGNHENRITRAIEEDARLEGSIGLEDLDTQGWTVHPFLEPVVLSGVAYSHYFYHPGSGRPYAGENLFTRLKTIGHSFTMGHQQGLSIAIRPVGKTRHQGLVVGSCYLHQERYLGPQTQDYWRGIVVCHQVQNGTYDPMMVSLDYLCRRYEGKSLKASRLMR
jgi:hypothetical protein